jgi:transcription elongation factor Elf1
MRGKVFYYMDCYRCSIREVCRIFELTKEIGVYAKFYLTECRMKPDTGNNNISDIAQAIAVKPTVAQDMGHLAGPGLKRDFKELSNQARKDAEELAINTKPIITQEKFKAIPKEEKSMLVNCPSCGGKTTMDDLTLCDEDGCGKEICSNCGTEDMANHKKYCEEHWATK